MKFLLAAVLFVSLACSKKVEPAPVVVESPKVQAVAPVVSPPVVESVIDGGSTTAPETK